MLYDWLQHIEFKNLWVLPFLLILPFLAWIYFQNQKRLKASFLVTTAQTFKVATFRSALVHLPLWLRLLAIGCVILALARPQIRNVQTRTKGEGIDIILCMDVSGSMLSTDFYPNRLEAAKQIAADFVKNRPVDEIGLVIFSGESYTLFPLSTDHSSLLEQIDNLKSGMLEDGTVIGEGLATAVERLMPGKEKTKVIILLTDGKEEAPDTRLIDPLTALEIAKAKKVKVYTIGMGAVDAHVVQERGVPRSQSSAFLDETLLRRIANQTGGQYFRAVDKESLSDIYNQIDRLEKSHVEVVTKTRFEEEFVYCILAALFFILLDIILKYTFLRTFP